MMAKVDGDLPLAAARLFHILRAIPDDGIWTFTESF
jgi:hypothetical protein